MLEIKSFASAAVVIGGIDLAEKIKKGQFRTGKLGGRTPANRPRNVDYRASRFTPCSRRQALDRRPPLTN